jgi:hypothetical protein
VTRVVRVEPEQRSHRDPHREGSHPLVDVDASARLQPVDRGVRLAGHRRHRGLDLLPVKRRHHHPALAIVVAAVDRQQAVTEQRDEIAEASLAPAEVLRVGDGDVLVRLRPEHEDDPSVEEADAEDRAELLVERQEDRQRVVGEAPRAGEVEVGGTRGIWNAGTALAADVVPHPQPRIVGGRLGAYVCIRR